MIKKKLYIEILTKILNECYDEIKLKSDGIKDRQQYITGYLNAAMDLDVFTHQELKAIIDKVHFKAFGKTIEERRKLELSEPSSDHDLLAIPAYIRGGISIEKG
jgi:hypothetical protein